MYEAIQVLSIIVAVLFGMFYAKNYGIGKVKGLLIGLFTQVIGFALIFILTWVESGFKNFGSQNAVRVYAFSAFIVMLESKIFKVDFRKCLDFQGIVPPLAYGVAHLACLFPKCCFGFSYTEGSAMYDIAMKLTGTDKLPMQLNESLSALIIFAVLLAVAFRSKFSNGGRILAYYQIAFGAERFMWEFLRDNKKVIRIAPMQNALSAEPYGAWWGISNLAIWSFAIFVAGVVLLICLNRADKKDQKISKINK